MRDSMNKFYAFLDQPIYASARLMLLLLALPLSLSFAAPLWRISMEAPQYPQGLYLDIYSYTLESDNHRQHIQEINTLNHYIGMHKLDRLALSDLDWIPFVFGGLLLLLLRVAAVGNVRSLIDLAIISLYACSFAMGRFVYRLYLFGHDLAPDAPVKVAPFTPAIIGTKQIANFTTHSYPRLGSVGVGIFLLGVFAVLLWHLIAGRRRARLKETELSASGAVSLAAQHKSA